MCFVINAIMAAFFLGATRAPPRTSTNQLGGLARLEQKTPTPILTPIVPATVLRPARRFPILRRPNSLDLDSAISVGDTFRCRHLHRATRNTTPRSLSLHTSRDPHIQTGQSA